MTALRSSCLARVAGALGALLVIACLLLSAQAGARDLCFEAELANRIEPVMEIWEDPECSGGRAVVIRQGAGGGQARAKPNGTAHYLLEVPRAGRYRAWLRMRWLDECSNSMVLVPPAGDQLTLTDAVFKRWHWVRSPAFVLAEGVQELVLRNREDGVGVDQLLLTTTAVPPPEGLLTPTVVPGTDVPVQGCAELEASVAAVCPGLPAKVSRRYDVSHLIRAPGEMPDFLPSARILPGQPVVLNLWVRNNLLRRDIEGGALLKACPELGVAPGARQPFSAAVNSLVRVPFTVTADEALDIAEHAVTFHVRSGGVLRRKRAVLTRPLEWRIIGPFGNPADAGLEVAHPPEHETKLDATYAGKSGPVQWRTFPLTETYTTFGFVDLQHLYGQVDWAAAYARTEIEADADGDITLCVMGDDMVRVWIDNEEVVTAGASLPATLNRRVRRVRLTRGRHAVLVKSCQGRNYWEFYVGFRPVRGQRSRVRGIPLVSCGE